MVYISVMQCWKAAEKTAYGEGSLVMNLTRASLLLGTSMAMALAVPAYAQVSDAAPPASPAMAAPAGDTPTPTAAPAAQAPQERMASGANAGDVTGEILVTAQRRSESLQRTPVAVSVLSGDTLTKRAIVTESDLQISSPGLTVRASQNSNQLNYAIRGQSLDAFSNTRPGVLPYVNEVQVGGAGGSSAFYDLQSVQVLKGPQGTLFGRNATGGAVLFTTNKPTEDFGGYALARLGNYDLRHFEGAINAPLAGDRAMLRVAGVYTKRDGYQRNLFSGTRAGNVDRWGLRGSLTVRPADGIKNELMIDYLHSDGGSLVGGIYSLNPPGLVPSLLLSNFGNVAVFDSIFGAGASAAYAAAHPKLDPGGIASYINTQKERGPYKIESDGPNSFRGRNLVISNITSFDVGTDTQIRNVLGYTRIDNSIFGDIDGIPYGIDDNGDIGNINKTRQFSEELQIVGKAINGNLSYVTGVYFSSEKNLNITGSRLFDFPGLLTNQTNTSQARNRTIAGYAQGTYDLSSATGVEGLGFTLGARYTREKIKIKMLPGDISFSDPDPVKATYDFEQSKTYGNLSWTGGIQYQANPNLLIYTVTRRSYRNGGYNGVVRPVPGLGSQGGNGYGRETVTDVELGAKYQGRMGEMPVRLSAALYNNWIKQAQRVAYTLVGGSPAAVTVNVPKAKVKGFELDGQISPASWLRLGGAVNYTDAKFTDNLVSVSGGPPVEFGTYPDTPEWSGSVFGEVTAPLGGDLTASLRSDVYAQSSTYFSSTGNLNPGTKLPSYKLVNFRVSIDDDKAGWSIAANLKNAFKKTYYVGGVGLGELFQFNTAVPGDPRTFLVEARLRF
jgi:iron complex outermembrane recepter protein